MFYPSSNYDYTRPWDMIHAALTIITARSSVTREAGRGRMALADEALSTKAQDKILFYAIWVN